MANKHNAENPDHPIVLSFADFSYWCYQCDSYIEHPMLNHVSIFYPRKFPVDIDYAVALKAIKD